ncbi:hypothetical protein [Tumebacillus permanentifrigoris]|uniref:Uncharacterized protein n=1 Tax=Tumebacillus permanentifrigoris TaxID=378543 RepID=A0A316D7A8_9BACL|nr:hypothetical protein [Tumebacillus permanentifrigoris]PWK05269.1 hypothetical protein C7459_12418 [Tumebacillus permanentifrigoris]
MSKKDATSAPQQTEHEPKTARFTCEMPEGLRDDLDKMGGELRYSRATLINMACASLVANYEAKGSFIFVDLLNPEHRTTKKGGR